MDNKELIRLAYQAREKAYVPYSDFMVGAALCTAEGKIYLGCNIENASYGATNCAERTAIFKAVSEGEKNFSKIAIVGGKREEKNCTTCFPCGICRQVMCEFCDPDEFTVVLEGEQGEILEYKLRELMPCDFGKEKLS